jgi:hypothetical protein
LSDGNGLYPNISRGVGGNVWQKSRFFFQCKLHSTSREFIPYTNIIVHIPYRFRGYPTSLCALYLCCTNVHVQHSMGTVDPHSVLPHTAGLMERTGHMIFLVIWNVKFGGHFWQPPSKLNEFTFLVPINSEIVPHLGHDGTGMALILGETVLGCNAQVSIYKKYVYPRSFLFSSNCSYLRQGDILNCCQRQNNCR